MICDEFLTGHILSLAQWKIRSIYLFLKYLSMKIILQWVQNSIFPYGKLIFLNLFSLTSNKNSGKLCISFMMFSLKCFQFYFRVNSHPYFQQWNSNWDKVFLNSPLGVRFELGFLNVGKTVSDFFLIHEKIKNWDFWMLL